MKIIKPSYEIVNISHNEPLQFIEQIGRVCYKSESNINNESAQKFVATLIKNGHEAMIEHVYVTIKFICDRGISHEIVRHRIASYAQESTRYCNYSKDKFDNELTFIEPSFWNDYDENMINKPNTYLYEKWQYARWAKACKSSEKIYLDLIEEGATPQEARSILPNSLKTEIMMTINLRSLRNFLKLRTAKGAHPQIKELAIPLLNELKNKIPVIFDDVIV